MVTRVAVIEDRALAIQELETRFAMAVRQRELLENYIRERLKPDKHYYKVGDDPGRKPSLKKEGAEIICLPHNLKPKYIILSGPDKPPSDSSPYQITVNCSLWRSEVSEGEGLGSASSYITTREGIHKPRQNDPGLGYNATLKMSCKSAYIAATLSATAASEFFTQDLEDDQTDSTKETTDQTEHFCKLHNTPFFKRGKMLAYGHPIKGTKDWCHEPKTQSQAEPPEKPPEVKEPINITQAVETAKERGAEVKIIIDMDWLKTSLKTLKWTGVLLYLRDTYQVTGETVTECLGKMTSEQEAAFSGEVESRLSMR